MEQIKVITLKKAMALLDACGFQYAIIDSDGTRHGKLKTAEPKTRRELEFPYGTITTHVKAHLPEKIEVGDVIEVPILGFGKERIRSVSLNSLSSIYGYNKFTSVIEGDKVQLMRVE
jgi:hypothetical protein